MPSCSRIARRCGETRCENDRRSRRDAHPRLRAFQISSAGHLRGPLGRDEVVVLVSLRVVGRLELPERLDLEAALPQHADPLAVRQLELDAVVLARSTRAGASRTAGAEALAHRRCPRRASTAPRASSSGGRRARRRAARAAPPRASTCTDRTRSTRRTPRPRGRTTRPAAARSSAFASISSIPIPVSALHPPRRLQLRRE